jgi:hypothetical protein
MASSNTLFKLRWVKAEHSRYFCALISLLIANASSYCTGCVRIFLMLSFVASSSLRSSLVPTSMMGTPGAWCSISGAHYGLATRLAKMVTNRRRVPYLGLDVVKRGTANN